MQAGQAGVPAGEIAQKVGAVQNTASAHLKALSQAGLVLTEREGRIVRYRADIDGFRDLLAFLMEDCCAGNPDICRPLIDAVTCSG